VGRVLEVDVGGRHRRSQDTYALGVAQHDLRQPNEARQEAKQASEGSRAVPRRRVSMAMFTRTPKCLPCFIFMDGIDTIGAGVP